MKKTITLLFLIILIISSCETDFKVNADRQEVTIVYGLLDQSKDRQYIKINKAFLVDGNALEMAASSNSTNYNPDSLEVKIYKVKEHSFGNFDTLGYVILNDTVLEKEAGLFSTDNNIVYTTNGWNWINSEGNINSSNNQLENTHDLQNLLR